MCPQNNQQLSNTHACVCKDMHGHCGISSSSRYQIKASKLVAFELTSLSNAILTYFIIFISQSHSQSLKNGSKQREHFVFSLCSSLMITAPVFSLHLFMFLRLSLYLNPFVLKADFTQLLFALLFTSVTMFSGWIPRRRKCLPTKSTFLDGDLLSKILQTSARARLWTERVRARSTVRRMQKGACCCLPC